MPGRPLLIDPGWAAERPFLEALLGRPCLPLLALTLALTLALALALALV